MSKKNFGRKRFGPYPGDFVNLYISRNVQILMIIKLSKRGPQIQLEPLLIKNRFNFVAGMCISMPLFFSGASAAFLRFCKSVHFAKCTDSTICMSGCAPGYSPSTLVRSLDTSYYAQRWLMKVLRCCRAARVNL